MNFSDIFFVLKWWLVLFGVGIVFLPITSIIFKNFFDRGYIFARILGMALISYVVFVLGILKILPFSELTIFLVTFAFLILNILIFKSFFKTVIPSLTAPSADGLDSRFRSPRWLASSSTRRSGNFGEAGGNDTDRSIWKIFLFQEIIFLAALFFWSYIRAHQPDIHGLEKYMDFGFVNSIIRSEYFPPKDMWLTPHSINYYYFGHLVTAVLTIISNIPSSITYNLMLSTIFALTFTGAFSIGANLIYILKSERGVTRLEGLPTPRTRSARSETSGAVVGGKGVAGPRAILAGLLTGFLVSMAGNLHAIYAFFKPYENENPVPFWQLAFSFNTFPNSYWYPNATRFIENTIHEFPIYSFVVSDLHGHFLDIPFVLLTIAVLLSLIFNFQFSIFNQIKNLKNSNSFQISNFKFQILLISFLLAVMYMTNAWDGVIYFILTAIVILYIKLRLAANIPPHQSIKYYVSSIKNKNYILHTAYYILLVLIGSILFSLPFSLSFKPFASGIGILCAPEFLTNIEHLGPFLFEKDHCLRSPIWQLIILYGFFYFFIIGFLVSIFPKVRMPQKGKLTFVFKSLAKSDIFVLLLILLSTLLIIIPEFIYIKDIYPGHYRANTMFKLVYQAFIMLSIASGYIIIKTVSSIKYQVLSIKGKLVASCYLLVAICFLYLVFSYPHFAINSYYNLKTYQGLDGIKYLKTLYPTDYEGILWINKYIKGQPVILEAQGDSYTDYARISANTGLPTVLGWTVHEWLWRGSYDIPSPRIPEVQTIYESESIGDTKKLINKYKIKLVFIGNLEKEKYPNLNEEKFKKLGKAIYENGNTRIYKID